MNSKVFEEEKEEEEEEEDINLINWRIILCFPRFWVTAPAVAHSTL